jgi:anti-sigma factor RsiW
VLLDDVVTSHVASLSSGSKLVEVASSDRHTVKPWFAGKTAFAPLVRDLSKDGFALVGGRLDHVGDRQTAAVVYRIRNHYVNLFMWRMLSGPSDEGESVRVIEARGFPLATWSVAGVRYAAISDVQRSDLERFARLASEP